MTADDFRSSETSAVIAQDGSVRIELVADDGSITVLRESVPVLAPRWTPRNRGHPGSNV